jgi:hypothetical protein
VIDGLITVNRLIAMRFNPIVNDAGVEAKSDPNHETQAEVAEYAVGMSKAAFAKEENPWPTPAGPVRQCV